MRLKLGEQDHRSSQNLRARSWLGTTRFYQLKSQAGPCTGGTAAGRHNLRRSAYPESTGPPRRRP
eukprot:6526206-Pyramimonas_sp.AAC.1